ncbi:AP-3 complex subunit beta-2-like isoform X5 [Symsagittifera roscoffensis]
MKTIIGMIAKGKDAGELFPQVVKNVVSKNVEVKKLVYVYLERYAEEQQDLALLSVATFQKALKDPNQLIRACALRVLSSIRVSVITPIMLLAIKDACADMSPFVRKSAANAIPKLYSLDVDTKEELILAIEKLLADKTTLVAGSAIYAFEQLCPDRVDLVHKHYRRLCSLLVDVDEWGQVVVANMLIRYAKTQFLDPNEGDVYMDEEAPKQTSDDPSKFFADSSEEESEDEKNSVASSEKAARNVMDQDHRLLLRNAKPLLQSRNSAVVMTVCQMYYYLAPRSEMNCIVKPMIRLLKSHREIQAVVLNWLVTFSKKYKAIVEPYLKSFYIRASDPTHVKLLKLEILTNLASETSISIILKEFQAYVHSSDPKFVGATIYAIGRCATTISEVSDQCLHGLMGLMASKNEIVVAESVVVTKKLLQQKPEENLAVIVHMAKMIDKITIPQARASILWMIGENCDKVQKYAPDVLRKFAKSFPNEEDIVKLQVVNLAAKMLVTNSKQVKLLVQYVLTLARFDENYDIRDRSRLIRALVLPTNGKNNLNKHAKKILFCEKPAPVLCSNFQSRNEFRMNTLSHYLNQRCEGYEELPDWPTEKPDASVRNVELPPEPTPTPSFYEREPDTKSSKTDKGGKTKKKPKSFYSDDDDESEDGKESEEEEESEEEDESSEEEEEEEDEDDSGSGSGSEEEDAKSTKPVKGKSSSLASKEKGNVKTKVEKKKKDESEEEEDGDDEESDEDDDDESEEEYSGRKSDDDSEDEKSPKVKNDKVKAKEASKNKKVEDDSDENEDASDEDEESSDEDDSKAVQSKKSVPKGKQNGGPASKASTPSLISSNRSSPSKAAKPKKTVSVSKSDSESAENSEDSQKDSRKATKKQNKKEDPKSSKGKNKSAKKKEDVEISEEVSSVVEEATLLTFDDEPSSSLPSGDASKASSQPMRGKPMLPTMISQTSEDRGMGNVPGTPTSVAGSASGSGPEGLEVLVSSPSALHVTHKEVELLNRLLGRGLSVKARFTRKPFIYNEHKVSVELIFANTATDNTHFSNISITEKKLPAGMSLDEFPKIGQLPPGQQQNAYIGIDFCDSLQPAHFTIACTVNDSETKQFPVQLSCTVGDLLRPCTCSHHTFSAIQSRLTGMNEHECKLDTLTANLDESELLKRVYAVCNVGLVPCSVQSGPRLLYSFSGVTTSTGTPVLVSVDLEKKKLTVNCEKMVVGSKLMKELNQSLAQ